jgi:hypothetical protein
MKKLILIVVALTSISCAGAKLNNDDAQRVIARQLDVPEGKVHISSVSEYANTALVESVLRTTFVLQKDSIGNWHVVRMQHTSDRWETPEEFLKSASPSAFSRSLESAFVAQIEESD